LSVVPGTPGALETDMRTSRLSALKVKVHAELELGVPSVDRTLRGVREVK
jgi:hypothetical protein